MARWFGSAAELAQWGGPEARYPLDSDQIAEWIAEGASPRPRTCYTAVDEADKPIGHVQLLHDSVNETARVGRFGVAPERRRSGIGKALLAQAIELAFVQFAVHRVHLHVLADNDAARRLYRCAGLVEEGTARDAMRIGERRHSVVTMSLLRPEWEARRSELAVA